MPVSYSAYGLQQTRYLKPVEVKAEKKKEPNKRDIKLEILWRTRPDLTVGEISEMLGFKAKGGASNRARKLGLPVRVSMSNRGLFKKKKAA